MSAEERIAELKKTLEYHIDRYYNQDSPEISDYEFDMLMQQLKKIRKNEHPELVTKRFSEHSMSAARQSGLPES